MQFPMIATNAQPSSPPFAENITAEFAGKFSAPSAAVQLKHSVTLVNELMYNLPR